VHSLQVYPIYTVVVTALVHPLMVHWIWVDSSWLNTLSSCRVLDFAGGLAVHALGEQVAAAEVVHAIFLLHPSVEDRLSDIMVTASTECSCCGSSSGSCTCGLLPQRVYLCGLGQQPTLANSGGGVGGGAAVGLACRVLDFAGRLAVHALGEAAAAAAAAAVHAVVCMLRGAYSPGCWSSTT
jgi:hypothetical protein